MDTTEIDSIKIHAAVSSGACTHEGEQLQLWYWAGDMEGFKSYHDVKISSPRRAHDGWRPTFIKPDGTVADGVSNVIVPHDRSNLIGYESNKLYPFRVQIPEWCRGKNVRFMLYQHTHGAGSAGSGGASGWGVDNIYITSLRFQRHNSIAITGPLDSPEGSNFIRVGNNSNVSSQARIKELNKIAENLSDKYDLDGRYLIRNSGTEPLLRVLIEAKDSHSVNEFSDELINNIKNYLFT